MPPSLSALTLRWAATSAAVRRDAWSVGILAALHFAAFLVMVLTEYAVEQKVAFLLTWGLLNFFWLGCTRRPATSAALSLGMMALLIGLSMLKYKVLWMTVDFVDLMIIDPDSIAFLYSIFPNLGWTTILCTGVLLSVLVLLWRVDVFRIPRLVAAAGAAGCLVALTALSFAVPLEAYETFYGANYVSHFARSGVEAIYEFGARGFMESDATVADGLRLQPAAVCDPVRKPPHIIMVHDESSFDIRALPGVRVPRGYGEYFRSFDGKERNFIVEGAGGPSWFTEYNVLSGLSARSFGRFAYFVTRIAAGRVTRGLPQALQHCGYQTFSLYPAFGAFMSAKNYQATTGVQRFVDEAGLGTDRPEPDQFYYDAAAKMIEQGRAKGPVFMFVYLAANHFPWDYRWRPDLAPHWNDLGNRTEVDEYLRRQTMSMEDYANFRARLKRDFPGESFLLVRYGDHQPDFASVLIDPTLDDAAIAKQIRASNPKYFTTYYAIDTVNYKPANVSSALDTIEGPYLPLVLQEAAGLPLDPSFAEQKRILERCHGLFYACDSGAEARRFNRLLIDAGLIKGL
jgi:hypothetical protein